MNKLVINHLSKKLLGICIIITFAVNAFAQNNPKPNPQGGNTQIIKLPSNLIVPQPKKSNLIKTKRDSISYGFGLNIAGFLEQQGLDKELNYDLVAKGMRDTKAKKSYEADPAKCNEMAILRLQEINQKKMKEAQKSQPVDPKVKEQKAAAAKFLKQNLQKPGIKSLPSGIQYEVLIAAPDSNIVSPTLNSTFVAHYAGTLLDGTSFDNSYARGTPLEMPVNGVIEGWKQVLQKMRKGDKWKVWIPSELGYGDNGTGTIPGGALLVFEIELLDIK